MSMMLMNASAASKVASANGSRVRVAVDVAAPRIGTTSGTEERAGDVECRHVRTSLAHEASVVPLSAADVETPQARSRPAGHRGMRAC